MTKDTTETIGLGQSLSQEHLSHNRKKLNKKIIIVCAVLILLSLGYFFLFSNKSANKFEYTKITQKDIQESVEITGNVEAGANISLSFRDSGQIEKIMFEPGDSVKKDTIIASLKNRDQTLKLQQAKANLGGASANLNQKLAGATNEEILMASAGLEKAEAASDKISIDKKNAEEALELIKQKYIEDEKKAQLLVDDAKTKFDYAKKNKTNTGNSQNQSVETAKEDLEAQLFLTGSQIQQSLINLKSIIIDDGNSIIEKDYNRLDNQNLYDAKELYYQVKQEFDPIYSDLRSGKGYEADKLKAYATTEQNEINKLLQTQKIVTDMLAKTPASSTLSTDAITNLKSKILADASSLSSSLTGLNLKYQNILTALLNVTNSGDTTDSSVASAENFYNQQLQNLAQNKIDHQVDINNREANIRSLAAQLKMQTADIESAKANLQAKKIAPRAVDVAFLRAQVASNQITVALAEEALEKTLIRAPFDGKLSRKNIDVGEYATASSVLGPSGKPMLEMISATKLKINANIAEVDIDKLKLGDKADITLDAIGDQTKFTGTISKIDPVETKIQDVVFYKTEIIIDSDDVRIKPGMSATVSIILNKADKALTVPEKAIQTDNDKKYIRIEKNKQVININVETGIRNLQGDIEIKSPELKEGQQVILKSIN